MSGPFGPNEAGEGRNDPTQVWSGQQPPGAAGPTQQWGGQTPPVQPTQQWADPNQAQQQWGQPQQQWGQTGGQPQQPWGQTPGQPQPQQQWGQTPGQPQQSWGQTPGQPQPQQQWGQAPGQQPQRSGGKTGLIIGLAVVGVLVLGGIVTLVLLLTATDKLDQNAVQNGVSSVLKDSYGITDVADVSCPADQKVEIDHTFQCTLKVNGEDKKVNIKVTKEDGTYEVGRPS